MGDLDQLHLVSQGSESSVDVRQGKRSKFVDYLTCKMASRGNLKFAIFVVTVLALVAGIALVVLVTKKDDAPTTPAPGTGDVTKPSTSTQVATNGEVFPYDNIRLPRHVLPLVYDIYMNPRIEQHEFSGKIDIQLKVNFPRNFVVLHSKKLTSDKKDVFLYDLTADKTYIPVKFLENLKNEQFYVEFKQDLQLFHDYKLTIGFAGELDTSLKGFYRSTYKIPNTNTTKTIGVTQFEATDARKAFPCFDEPAMKAVYNMKMTRLPSYKIWFNMPLKSSLSLDNGLVEDTFETTVKMSSYLVAFVVADGFSSITAVTKNNVKISIVTPEHMVGDAKYALTVTGSVLDYYVTLFGVPFPLPKLDLVAIPDFSAGAMENWGLITYRLTMILLNERTASASDRQKVAMVISHEIAHQWFGNIVTMDWWTDLWLNEGFASYVEYLGIDQMYKEDWSMAKQFVSRDMTTAMHKDCYKSSHPILIEVSNPNEINALFDTITYAKGATVIRMAKFMLGEKRLGEGLSNYMKRYQFDNTVTSQLWDEFSKVITDIDVTAVMKSWTDQMGYPVLTVHRSGDSLTLTQSRFLLYSAAEDNSKYSPPGGRYLWKIPFTVFQGNSTDKEKSKITILDTETSTIRLSSATGWYKANTDYFGYYRVNYDQANWKALCQLMKNKRDTISEMDRAQLLDDSMNLARAGQLDMSIAFDLTLNMNKEESFVVWSVFLKNINYIVSRMNKENQNLFKKYMAKKVGYVITQVGWKTQTKHINRLLQSLIIKYAVSIGHKDTLQIASDRFNEFMSENIKGNLTYEIRGDLKGAVYKAGVANGGEDEWNFLWNRYLKDDTKAAEKYRIMNTLAYTKNISTLQNYLNIALDPTVVRKGDFMYILRKVAVTGLGGEMSWQFVKDNWDVLYKRYGEGSFSMSRMVLSTSSHFSTEEKYNEVKEFYAKHHAGSGAGAVPETLEKIKMNIAYLANNGDNISKWLRDNTE